MKKELLNILRSDVKLALGCTGPISVAFATSVAAKRVGGELKKLRVIMDRDTYKNSISVATPGTPYMGVLQPAVVGAIYGNPDYRLEVIKDLKDFDRERVDKFAKDNTTIEIKWDYKGVGLYIEAIAETDKGTGRAIVAKTHDGVVLVEVNGKVVEKDESYDAGDAAFETKKPIRAYSVRDFYDFAAEVPLSDIEFLREAVTANMALAKAGLDENLGAGFGNGFKAISDSSMYMKAKIMAAAAADARMSGKELSAMSCGGSGNVGITACVPLVSMAESLGCPEEKLLRAIALSYLLVISGKAHIGRLSAMCACAMVASIGVAAGACLMLGGSFEQIEWAIGNLVGSTGGVLCDGAKYGCAMKLASGAGLGIECAQLAMQGVRIPALDGLVGNSADDTIGLLGRIASKGMLYTDEYMCKEIIHRENVVPVEL